MSEARPAVDVVVPFVGSADEMEALCGRLRSLRTREGDSLTIADNGPKSRRQEPPKGFPVELVPAGERRTPAFARNAGARRGSAEWIVFFDADAAPCSDLLDLYFDPHPAPRTALLGGGVIDEEVPRAAPAVARYGYLRNLMSQERTFGFGEWGYPKSANVACRRAAFEAIGGFREDIRAGEDADLTYRLKAAGWGVERRESASVVHFNRTTLHGLIEQQLLWGAGGAWLERTYPGSVPLIASPAGARWSLSRAMKALLSARQDRDAALYALLRPVEAVAWQTGRLLPNRRPRRRVRVRGGDRP